MKQTFLFGCLFLAACSSSTSNPSTPATSERIAKISTLPGNAAAGKTVYETTASPACVSCHKADGKGQGNLYPSLVEPSQTDPVDELAGYILNGKNTGMPKQTGLSDQQVADVIAYMKETFK